MYEVWKGIEEVWDLAGEFVFLEIEGEEAGEVGELRGNGAAEVVVGEVEAEEAVEG